MAAGLELGRGLAVDLDGQRGGVVAGEQPQPLLGADDERAQRAGVRGDRGQDEGVEERRDGRAARADV